MTEKRKTGTFEWSDSTINIADGCSHGCRYCLAYAPEARVKRG